MVVSRGTISKWWGSRGAFFPAVDAAAADHDRADFAWAGLTAQRYLMYHRALPLAGDTTVG